MTKEITTIQASLDTPVDARRPRKERHLLFTGTQDDFITIPICGNTDSNIVATRKQRNVTCAECLEVLEQLAQVDSYDEAADIIQGRLPKMPEPDPEVMEERFNKQPTERAAEHMKSMAFIKDRALPSISRMTENVIGTQKELFYRNLIHQRVIYGPSEANESEGRKLGHPRTETLTELGDKRAKLVAERNNPNPQRS